MGCFSFTCKNCGEPILSDSFQGQRVKLFLLENGRVIDHMQGEYDSYGKVFVNEPYNGDLREAIAWIFPWSSPYRVNGDHDKCCCDLIFDSNPGSGIAAVHEKCLKKGYTPTTQSADDPNQGWGEDLELLGGNYVP